MREPSDVSGDGKSTVCSTSSSSNKWNIKALDPSFFLMEIHQWSVIGGFPLQRNSNAESFPIPSCLQYFAAAIQWFCVPDTRSRGRTQKRKSDTADVCKAEVERFAVKRGWRSFYHRNNNGCFQQKETPMNFRENVDKDGNTLDLDNAIGSSYYFIACSPYELGKPSEWDSKQARHISVVASQISSKSTVYACFV